MDTPAIQSISIPLSVIQQLSYHFPQFENVRPRSIHPQDHPIYRVKIIPFELGAQIRHLDSSEQFFHIELFPLTDDGPLAELWHISAWTGSLSRRVKYAPLTIGQKDPVFARAQQFEYDLAAKFRAQGLTPKNAEQAAQMLVRGLPLSQWVQVLALTDEEISAVIQIRKELQAATAKQSTAIASSTPTIPAQPYAHE